MASLSQIQLKKKSIVYLTMLTMPMFNNHLKRLKFSIFEAETIKYKRPAFYDQYDFKIIKTILNFKGGYRHYGVAYKPGEGISIGSPCFKEIDHGEINFIHHTASEARQNIIRAFFRGTFPHGQAWAGGNPDVEIRFER
jgi:hypothetical protein